MSNFKYLLLPVVLFLIHTECLKGQDELSFQIGTSTVDSKINIEIKPLFEERVRSVFNHLGVIGDQYEVLVIYPELFLLETGNVEGLENRVLSKLRFSIQVKNRLSGAVISSESQILTGSGSHTDGAIRKALSQIKPGQNQYQQWVEKIEERQTTYYDEHCSEILAEAKIASDREEYDRAIVLLKAIPTSSNCIDQSQSALLGYYQQYQEQQCQKALQQAEVAMQQEKFAEAIEHLSSIDPESSCGPDAKLMLKGAGRGLDKQNYAKYQFLNKVYEDKLKLEAARQQNMERISGEYLEKN